MGKQNGAMSVAEAKYEFRASVGITFNNEQVGRDSVLRTTLDDIGTWQSRNAGVSASPYTAMSCNQVKQAAVIGKEIWVFDVDCTRAQDIVASVRIAMDYYKTGADTFISNVYAKNLNIENEYSVTPQQRIDDNKQLYTGLCTALTEAANILGVQNPLELHVFSKDNNEKILADDLHTALRDGGAIVRHDKGRYKMAVGSNDYKKSVKQYTSLHIAVLNS